jgi:hypothetical protein
MAYRLRFCFLQTVGHSSPFGSSALIRFFAISAFTIRCILGPAAFIPIYPNAPNFLRLLVICARDYSFRSGCENVGRPNLGLMGTASPRRPDRSAPRTLTSYRHRDYYSFHLSTLTSMLNVKFLFGGQPRLVVCPECQIVLART